MSDLFEVVGVWLAVAATLAVFSLLVRDNPLYKAAEHLFVGLGAAYFITTHAFDTLEPDLVRALATPSPREGGLPSWTRWGAVLLGGLLLARLLPKGESWSRLPLAFLVAVFAAVKLTTYLVGDLLGQVDGLFAATQALVEETAFVRRLGWLVLVTGTLAGLVHFLFSVPRGPVVRGVSRYGVWVLMVAFGASFGFAVQGRMALLIDRMRFLQEHAGRDAGWATGLLALAVVGLLLVRRPAEAEEPEG